MGISSDMVPPNGPEAHSYPRGVRWSHTAPDGYKRIIAHDSRGRQVMQHDVLEDCLDGGEMEWIWQWLDEHCPVNEAEIGTPTRFAKLRLLA